jgi:hypothetical protein
LGGEGPVRCLSGIYDTQTFAPGPVWAGKRRSCFVKGFGRRLAYESLRRTNPRLQGQAYGDLMIWLCRGGRTPRFLDCPGSASRGFCWSITSQIGGRRSVKQAMASGISRLNGAGESMDAQDPNCRSSKATAQGRHKPCRVTASPSRVGRDNPAARAVASSVERS